MTLPRVTDHAVLRYLERARGIDIELIREHIALICAPAAAVGAANLKRDGVKYVFENGSVITVVPDEGTGPSKTHRRRATGELQR